MDSMIFDVDGTLWDTTFVCAEAWNRAIAENSDTERRVKAEELKRLFGKPMNVIFEAVFPEMSEKERERLAGVCCEYEHEYLEKAHIGAFDGVCETMVVLAEKMPLFIVSNCQKGYIELFLDKTGLEGYIKDYLCYGDTLAEKSVTMKELIRRNNLTAPVYVGDTRGDEEACKEAGVPFVFASYGFGDAKMPYKTIRRFSELIGI